MADSHDKSHSLISSVDHSAGTDNTVVGTVGGVVSEVAFSTSASANSIARRDANGDVIVPVTPSASSAATSSTYVGSQIEQRCKRSYVIYVLGPTTAATTGDGKEYLTVPAILDGATITDVEAAVITAGTTNTLDIQIHNVTDAVDILSTVITIDSTETHSKDAATPAVINGANDTVSEGDLLRVDIDAIHSTPSQGLMVVITFSVP